MNEFIQNYILQFPQAWQFNYATVGDQIDSAVNSFAATHAEGLAAIKRAVVTSVTSIQKFLTAIPCILIVLMVVLLSYYLLRKWKTAVLYGLILTFVGCCGLWQHMIQTLSLAIFAVFICILLGFPLGILLAISPRASNFLRPVLDTMQTIPSWVYLIPMVMLFSTKQTPALFATVVYGIVPMIRMTSHGLTHVDPDMLEASTSFGATRIQTLLKVQIPQAKSTIMTGVNQTIMMCMAMVVTAAMVGAEGLGMDILLAVNQTRAGRGLFPGICVVIIAIILDRLTQALAQKSEVEKHD